MSVEEMNRAFIRLTAERDALRQQVATARAALQALLSCTALMSYAKADPIDATEHRKWVNVGVWLYPGEELLEADATALRQARKALEALAALDVGTP